MTSNLPPAAPILPMPAVKLSASGALNRSKGTAMGLGMVTTISSSVPTLQMRVYVHHFIRRCRCEWSRGTCVPGEFRTTLDTLFDTGRRYIFCINPNDTRLPNPLERRWFRDNQTPSIAMSGIDGADLPCNWSARHIGHGVSQRRIQIDLVSGDIDHSS